MVQRTGWGKSAVYFVATLLLRAQGSGPTVIVSPLLALMRNQIAAAERAGIRAVTINSTNIEDWQPINDAINAGEVDVLLVSPERLNNPGFRDEVLPRLAATCGLLVVDEAHCISDWGHDFRPDYRRIRTLLGDLPDGIPVLATTATANARVTSDVAEQLGRASTRRRPGAPRLARPGVAAARRGPAEDPGAAAGLAGRPPRRAARLGHRLLPDRRRHPGDRRLPALARPRRGGVLRPDRPHRAARPRAGRSPPGEVKALVATSALGMGFDATLGFVVNMGAPASPVAYYQQVGRAGRGTDEATVVLLPALEDRDIWAYFGSLAFPRETLVRQTIEALAAAGRPLSTAALETYVELNRTRLETMLKVLDVDGAVRRVRGGWEATGREWVYDEERYRRVAEAREREQAAMLDYLDTDGLPDALPARAARRPRGRRLRALRQLRRVRRCPPTSRAGALEEADARLARPGRRGRAAQDVADRAGQPRRRPQGQDRRRCRRGPGGGPADRPRPRPGAARPVPRPTRPTARCRCRWCRP